MRTRRFVWPIITALLYLCAVPVFGAAPALGNIQTATGDDANPVVTKPTGLSNDDLIILLVVGDQSNKSSPEYTWPSGADAFTEIDQDGDSVSDAHIGAAYRIVDGGESATFTVTAVTTTDTEFDIWAIAVTGAHATSPLDVTGTITLESVNSADILSVTTVADALAFYLIGHDGSAVDMFGQPTGWTEQAEGGFGNDGAKPGSAWGTKTSSGATGNATVSISTTDGTAHFQFAIAPAAAGGNTLLRRRRTN